MRLALCLGSGDDGGEAGGHLAQSAHRHVCGRFPRLFPHRRLPSGNTGLYSVAASLGSFLTAAFLPETQVCTL
jgi:hypothetical protein